MTPGPGEIDPSPPPYPPPRAGEGREGTSERSSGAPFPAVRRFLRLPSTGASWAAYSVFTDARSRKANGGITQSTS